MAIPTESDVKPCLLLLLGQHEDGAMHCNDVYRELATWFPGLTPSEVRDPYKHSLSHWANRVQFAVRHLREERLVLHHTLAGGRGVWALSSAGRERLARLPDAEELLKEIEGL